MKGENNTTFVEGFSEILMKKKIISKEDMVKIKKDFSRSSKEQFDTFLLSQGLIQKSDLLSFLSIYYNVPSFDVVGIFFNSFLLYAFPKDFLLRNGIIPLEIDNGIMTIIASQPTPAIADRIGKYVSYNVHFFVGIKQDICDAVKEFYDESLTEIDNDSIQEIDHDDVDDFAYEKVPPEIDE